MPSFSLVIEYLTGYAVATNPANREEAEWPPHPARVFMALAAAHFETDPTNVGQREALEWLAALDPPDMTIPDDAWPRDVLTVYVPVNDMDPGDLKSINAIDWKTLGKDKKKLDSKVKDVKVRVGTIPEYRRNNQPRTFPRVFVGDAPVRLTWQIELANESTHLDALEDVCRQVTRIGHSSSLVWMRLEREVAVEPTHQVDPSGLGLKLRTPFRAMMRVLDSDYGQAARDAFEANEISIAALRSEIERLKTERKQTKGKGAAERKKVFDEQIQAQTDHLDRSQMAPPPPPVRPRVSHATSYVRVAPEVVSVCKSCFDPNFIVLRPSDDAAQSFGLESTAAITAALRNLIMKESGVQPAPSWVSGHEANGEKLSSGNHMAIVPLAFVGRPWVGGGDQFADGHLMGLGLLLPREVTGRERAAVLSPSLFDQETNQPRELRLTMGRAGVWEVVRDTTLTPRLTLDTRTYTAASRRWASVTPVILDRMPKADRVKDPVGWRDEVADIIIKSCHRVSLPSPTAVGVEKTPFFLGSLRAMPGQGGFPLLRQDKFQVHIVVEFDQPVEGPVLLGAGRFRGFGLMRPWQEKEGR